MLSFLSWSESLNLWLLDNSDDDSNEDSDENSDSDSNPYDLPRPNIRYMEVTATKGLDEKPKYIKQSRKKKARRETTHVGGEEAILPFVLLCFIVAFTSFLHLRIQPL
jgi:hypothetical protein